VQARKKKDSGGVRAVARLSREREVFIEKFFRKGASFTKELLAENARLRLRAAELEAENHELRKRPSSDRTLAQVMTKLDTLEKKKKDLASRFRHAAETSRVYEERADEIERELADLANLYVASHQLHSTLDVRAVARGIRELLQQLVGAKSFAVYILTDRAGELGPILWQGVEASNLPLIRSGQGIVGSALATGETFVAKAVTGPVGVESPLAVVPMRVDDRIVGVIVVFELLEQKREFVPVDFELFKLLGAHAATALVGARLYARGSARPPTVDEYLDLL